MKKIYKVGLPMVLCVSMLAACGANYEAEESTVNVLKDGEIVSCDVEEFPSNYKVEDLESYVDTTISDYLSAASDATVKKQSLKAENGKASLVIKYDSADTYEKFNGMELYAGTVADAKNVKGYAFDVEFAEVNEGVVGAAVDGASIMNQDDLKVVVYKGTSNIHVDGTILYTSVDNVVLVDKSTVAIKDGENVFGNKEVTVPATEQVVSYEETTETELAEEVMEDTPSSVEEDVDSMVFDFPAEEVTEESEFTSVYTYVIYK